MKHKSYKQIFTFIAICFLGNIFAQKFDKKYTENFKVNKDVEVAVNASNTDINVTTWNKNEVDITAYIEVEGISKQEAEKYFKNWNFEALGNSKKVKITSKGSNSFGLKNDFVFFNDADFDFQIPEIDMSNIEAIILPEMDFDFDLDNLIEGIEGLEDLEDNIGKNGKYSFMWIDDDHNIKINSKEEWEAFKRTKEYKELKGKMKIDKEKMRKDLAESKEKLKKQFKETKARIVIDKEEIKKQLEIAKKHIKELKFDFNSDSNDFTIDGKKVKIKKRLEIKVPKGATFDLNTRHCKVKLPNTVASGNVKYGTFDANNLNGGELTINYSSVNINDLNACTLFLNNVTDAKIASVTNTKMNNNSSGVNIAKVYNNVDIKSKFGELEIASFVSDFKSFNLLLDSSEVLLNLSNIKDKLNFEATRVEYSDSKKISSNNLKTTIFHGFITANNDRISIDGKSSKLAVIK